ncbi:PKD domain-containing protein [Candidatus Acetothermia bacterium]|nr:PKD domain-containing protein [Candidatus Acetothermia bacterium]
MKVAGEERFHGSYTLKPNESKTFDVTLTFFSPGSIDIKAETPNASRSLTVTVRSSQPQPLHADFTADPTSGKAPLTVYFTNRTTGNFTSLFWDFGDGLTGSETNPIHTYAVSGRFTVRLTARGPSGEDTATKQGYIAVGATPRPLRASFSASPTSGTAPLTVYFTNQTSGDYTTLLWDFGDGTTSSETNPVHTYSSAGSYTVQLTAHSPGGDDTARGYISVSESLAQPPHADFTASPISGTAPLAVYFTNRTTGSYTSLLWDFGSGVTSSEINPVVTYNSPGIYTVKLTARGPGGEDTAIKNGYISVSAAPSIHAAFAAVPTSGSAPLTVYFKNESSGPYTNLLWDFGDGFTSRETNPTHTYTSAGNYTVKLSAFSSSGTDIATGFITVSAAPPPSPKYDSAAGEWDGYLYLPDYKPSQIWLDIFTGGQISGWVYFTDTGFKHTIDKGQANGQQVWFQFTPWVNTYAVVGTVNSDYTSFDTCEVQRWDSNQWVRVGGCRLSRPAK